MAKTCEEILDDYEESRRLASYWKSQVTAYDEANARWYKRGDKIVKRYKDERDKASEEGTRRLNMLWSNIQIMRPALYGRRPVPLAERRFLDHDTVGRTSAMILERSLRNEIEENGYHAAVKKAVMDYLLPGRGQCWVRYEPEIGAGVSIPPMSFLGMEDAQGPIEDPDESEQTEKLEETGEQLIAESCPVDYLAWKDFYMFPARARTWEEITAVGKRVYLSREECVERFGEDIGKKIQADASLSVAERMSNYSINTFQDQNERKRVVFEIWNKADRRVYWVTTGYDCLADLMDDPLELKGFFPCPEPLSATLTNDSLIPVPDYIEYQDQAIQIDELTQRISLLTKALKVAGVYDAANRPLRRLLDESVENELIPVDDWARYGDKGGVEGAISFLPIKQVAEVLEILIQSKGVLLQDLDRVSGISDVQRGTNDARETLGGVRLRQNGTSTRLDERRNEVARFARDVIRLVAEITAKHFSAKTLIEASGILFEEEFASIGQPGAAPSPLMAPQGAQPQFPMLPPPGGMRQPQQMGAPMGGPMPMAPGLPVPVNPMMANPMMGMSMPMVNPAVVRLEKAIELLRNDVPRGYRIDIETDSTIAGDAAEERKDAAEFLGAVAKYLETAGMMGAQQPGMIPLLGKMLQFGVRKFRTGRDLESTIDDFVDRVEKEARQRQANPQNKPDPHQLELQAQAARSQAEITKAQIEAQAQATNDQREQQTQALKAQLEIEKMRMEMEWKREEHAMRMQELAAKRVAYSAEHGLPPPQSAAVEQHNNNIAQFAQAAQLMHAAATSRKRIVRGPDGRAIGVEPIEDVVA